MKIIKGLIGFVIFAVGTFFLTAYISVMGGVEPNRGMAIFLVFLSLGVGRLGYSLFTGYFSLPTKESKSSEVGGGKNEPIQNKVEGFFSAILDWILSHRQK